MPLILLAGSRQPQVKRVGGKIVVLARAFGRAIQNVCKDVRRLAPLTYFNFTAVPSGPSRAYSEETLSINASIDPIIKNTNETYTLSVVTTGGWGTMTIDGETKESGELFKSRKSGPFKISYTGKSVGTHLITLRARSSIGVGKTAGVSLRDDKYLEPFDLTVNQRSGNYPQGKDIPISVVIQANSHIMSSSRYFIISAFLRLQDSLLVQNMGFLETLTLISLAAFICLKNKC